MSLTTLYFLAILPNLQILFGLVGTFSGIFAVALWVASHAYKSGATNQSDIETSKSLQKTGKYVTVLFVLCILLNTFIPDQRQMALIFAANYLTNNEEFKKIPNVAVEYINSYIEKQLPKMDNEK